MKDFTSNSPKAVRQMKDDDIKTFNRLRYVSYVAIRLGLAVACIAHSGCVRNEMLAVSKERLNNVRTSVWLLTSDGSSPSAAVLSRDGEKLSSWRFRQYICDGSRFEPYMSEPWNGKVNSKFRSESPSSFCFDKSTNACVFAVIGEGTAFDHSAAKQWEDVPPNTVILIEAYGRNVHWMQPVEIDVNSMFETSEDVTLSDWLGNVDKGVLIGFVDMTVWRISDQTPLSVLKQFFEIESAALVDRENMLGSFRIRL